VVTFLLLSLAKKTHRLPCILDRDEVYRILSCVRTFHNYACLATIYACGLRIFEALALQVFDIDGKSHMIHIHRGKGAKDRYVPLPVETCQLLRQHWSRHRNPVLIFPAMGRGHQQASTSTQPGHLQRPGGFPGSSTGGWHHQTPGQHPYPAPLLRHSSA